MATIKRNNPGNIRKGIPWKGSYEVPGDGFSYFDSLDYGFRALLLQILSTRKKAQDLVGFFKIYAPAKDHNDPIRYAAAVKAAIGSDQVPVDLPGLKKMAVAMTRIEQGLPALSRPDLDSLERAGQLLKVPEDKRPGPGSGQVVDMAGILVGLSLVAVSVWILKKS